MADQSTITIGGGISWRVCAYACIFFLLVGAGLGAWGMHTWQVSDLRTELALTLAKLKHAEEKPPIVKEQVKTETKTQLQYVKGETVYLPAPTAANPNATQATKLDGKFTIGKPDFVYTVNGRPGKFTRADDEKFVFERNMVQLNQASTIKIEAEIPIVDRTKHGAIGIGYGSHGLAGKLDIKAGWLYLDKDTKAGGIQYRF